VVLVYNSRMEDNTHQTLYVIETQQRDEELFFAELDRVAFNREDARYYLRQTKNLYPESKARIVRYEAVSQVR